MGHSCRKLVGHSCRKLLWDTLIGHSCGTLLRDTLVRHSCGTRLRDTLVGHSNWDTLVGHSCGSLLQEALAGHSLGTILMPQIIPRLCKSQWHCDITNVVSPQAVMRAFRTRRPPKVTRRGCKTSVSYETSSKSHVSSLQNERFVRDLPQNSHANSAKRAFRTRLPPKVTRQSLQNERFVRDFLQKPSGNTHRSTHITQPCEAVSRVQPLQTIPAHTPIPM